MAFEPNGSILQDGNEPAYYYDQARLVESNVVVTVLGA